MNVSATNLLTRLSDNQKAALISLLTDEDQSVYQTIRGRLIAYGPEVSDWLRPHVVKGDPLMRRRAQEIICHFARQQADNDFLSFCLRQGEELDLEEGAWLLARTQYPDANREAYRALLDSYASDLRERLDLSKDATIILGAINRFLFQELRFFGNEQNYYDPDNSYLNRVIDRRTGNPVSLCVVYLLLARRLRLPITGIGLPGHFICRFQSPTEEVYIDAFNRGKLLTKADCVKFLNQNNFGQREGFMIPVSPRRILMRICSNLHQIYQQLEQPAEMERFQRYLLTLAK